METTNTGGQIYQLIGKAIDMIGAIGKDKKNAQQGFMYRGIDQVYNALNPVMAKLGIFFCPEVLEQKREERTTKTGSVLIYTLLTMKYTAYAPDGSSVSMTVVGEGMDSGDKSSNKAMSVAMKYAMFQLFCIPTEEMKDPDADVYTDILPKGQKPQQPAQQSFKQPQNGPVAASVTTGTTVPDSNLQARCRAAGGQETPPPPPEPKPETPAAYLKRCIAEMQAVYGDSFNFAKLRGELIQAGKVRDVPSAIIKMDEAQALMAAMAELMNQRKAG